MSSTVRHLISSADSPHCEWNWHCSAYLIDKWMVSIVPYVSRQWWCWLWKPGARPTRQDLVVEDPPRFSARTATFLTSRRWRRRRPRKRKTWNCHRWTSTAPKKKYRDRKLPCFGSAAGPLLFFRHCCVTDVCVEFNHQRSFSIRDSSLVGALADEWCREISLVAAEKARTLATSKTFVVVGKRRRCCCDDLEDSLFYEKGL